MSGALDPDHGRDKILGRDIEIASPADSRTGMWSAYQGGKILVVKFGLRQLLDRLDELLASG
jgi:hypothetical protein